ncbi:MAG: tRNA lysidine(34) synthetase TilS [Nocardioidaceae bacterium]
MTGRLDPAVADTRRAVRTCLADLEPGSTVLVACSGGADSVALAAAAAFEGPKLAVSVGGVSVDHQLRTGSDEPARLAAKTMAELGLDPVEVAPVEVPAHGGGPEAAARVARYEALDGVADRVGATAVLLGHTRDDQAETVLLGLARGSGGRSLAGMRARVGRFRRPFLGLSRATTQRACAAQQLAAWQDPHNDDPRFARVRVRNVVLPVLEAELGPGIAAALARSARLLSDDADLLDSLAEDLLNRAATASGLDAGALLEAPAALRSRMLRMAAVASGCPRTDLTAEHVQAVESLLTAGGRHRSIDLPGSVQAVCRGVEVRFVRRDVGG